MARDPSQIPVMAEGDVSFAPVGTTLPTDATSALDAAFKPAGYTDEDGVTLTPDVTSTEVPTWQGTGSARVIVNTFELTLVFSLLEWTADGLVLAFGGGTYTPDAPNNAFTFLLPLPAERKPVSMVIDAVDGDNKYRLVSERAQYFDQGDVPLNAQSGSLLPVTYRLLAGTTDPRQMIIYGKQTAIT